MPLEFTVASLPSQSLAYTNCIYANLDDFLALAGRTPKGVTTKEIVKSQGLNVVVNNMVFAVKSLEGVAPGTIGMGSLQRQSSNLAMNQSVTISPLSSRPNALATVSFELQLLTRGSSREAKTLDCTALSKVLSSLFVGQVFTVNQLAVVDFSGLPVRLKVTSVVPVESTSTNSTTNNSTTNNSGQLVVPGTSCHFSKGKDAPIKLVNQTSGGSGNKIFKPDFDFSKLGIGGLDEEFNAIFRRAFASRVFPPSLVQQMGINHVRGMLLFGPPGCGKTLIARQIGKVLNAREPKVVNGPEILDKFVGESERKIRDLFADARTDQDENGEDAELHIIIFDEIDAVCKSRGSSRDGTGVGDSVVNQLLTQIDGVDSLNNVLVIGMTNRKDMLDEALLRPGRLEVQMEINLPDEKGRGQILQIHTSKARSNEFLSKDVLTDLQSFNTTSSDKKNLAQRTKNFSGAEIEGLVRAATAHALSRGTDGKTFHAKTNFKPSIEMKDFDLALTEIKPKFGSPLDGLGHLFRHGIIQYGKIFNQVQRTFNSLVHQVRDNTQTSLMSVLLHGVPGAGKTALAASVAVASEFPLVRLISAADFIGLSDSAKCNKIYQVFQEAYKSPLSIIILDDIERLLDYTRVGPRFSNAMLQALMVMVKNAPPPPGDRSVLVIGITSAYDAMEDLGLTSVFDVTLEVPVLVKPAEIKAVLKEASTVEITELDDIVATFTSPVSVKKLLMITEMASQDARDSGKTVVTATQYIDCMYKFNL